jgi:hypothetical protein
VEEDDLGTLTSLCPDCAREERLRSDEEQMARDLAQIDDLSAISRVRELALRAEGRGFIHPQMGKAVEVALDALETYVSSKNL